MLIQATSDTKLRNFVLKAIQGTQVPIYTNTHYFCIFQNFIFYFSFLESNKKKKNANNVMHESMIPKQIRVQARKSYFRMKELSM